MRKLIIQIPCLNEEKSLAVTLAALPRHVDGYDAVEWLVVDDGSTDGTVDVARRLGVDHIVKLPRHMGLARAFMAGLEASLAAGADTIVNTDADNQYAANSIRDLVRPILEGRAQMVIGVRPINEIESFSPLKKWLQKVGSRVVAWASAADVPDAPSGFRAIHRDAAVHINVFSSYTYTLETIIQAGRKKMAIACVPVAVNGPMRPSRLMRSTASYVWRSIVTIFRIFVIYKPLRFFFALGTALLVPGVLLGLRFTWQYLTGDGSGHVQSLILTAILITAAVMVYAVGILADIMSVNRTLLEDIRARSLRESLKAEPPSPTPPAAGVRARPKAPKEADAV